MRAQVPRKVPVEKFSSIEAAVEAICQGKVVIVVDAEDRENEGDFVCAAEKVTPEIVNFMITHGRGQLCMPLLPEVCERLKVGPMVESNTTPLGTSFTIPVDHRSAKTGITAQERARAILEIINPASRPADFVRPGHLFPLVAKEGGASAPRRSHRGLGRSGPPGRPWPGGGAVREILGPSGDRADRKLLFELAARHDLPIITIEELIRFRRRSEKLVYRIVEASLPSRFGMFKLIFYGVKYEPQQPFVLVMGEPDKVAAPLVRLHSSCFTGDVLNSLRCDCGDQLHMAMDMIGNEGAGALIYLPQEGRGIGLVEKIKAYALQDQGMDTVEANLALGYQADTRDYGIGIQLLKDLGLSKVRLLTNNPKKTDAFIYGGFDLEVVDQVPILPPINEHNARYIATKREKLGHNRPDAGG